MQTRVPLVAVLLDAVVLEAQREDVVVDEDAELPPELPRGTTGTRRVVANFWQNFGKSSLVFGCIGADLCKQMRALQHFSKSTTLSS